MSLVDVLAAERQRREAAETENTQLRALLANLTALAASQRAAPAVTAELAHVVGQLKQAEQQLEDQQDLLRLVIDNSPNLVYVENEAGECILANKRYEELRRQLTPAAAMAAATILSRQLLLGQSSEATVAYEESYLLQDGQTRWYNTTRSPLVRSDGSRYLLTFSSDITELKRAHRAVEESGRAKQLFLANISHEFRTPLHGVLGLTELLKKESLSAEQHDYLEMIQYSTEHLSRVIDDVLDFTRTELGEIVLEDIPFDLLRAVQQAARSLAFKMAEKGLQLRVQEPAAPLPLVQGDPYRLHQVLVNLIGNAVKFTPRGAITITIEPGEVTAQKLPITLSVADTGIGISAENLEQIFTSFQQANSSIPRLYGGTGLGLTICKNLVELQGGRIGVSSVLGQGSCFYFTIAYALSEQPLPAAAPSAPSPLLLRGLQVLLVEDNAINQLLAVAMLGQWQMEIDLAQNGEQALARARQRRYDVILMDIQMPELDGIAAAAQLRAEAGPNQSTAIIAVTADAIRINADSCQALGFTGYLLKPYTEATLLQALARLGIAGPPTALPASPGVPLPLTEFLIAPTAGLHYDFLALGKLGTDAEFIRKLLEMFISRVPLQLQALQAAIAQAQWEKAAEEAHKLKSTFGSLNIQPATDHLKKLETLTERRTPSPELPALLRALAEATEQLITQFTQHLLSLATSADPTSTGS